MASPEIWHLVHFVSKVFSVTVVVTVKRNILDFQLQNYFLLLAYKDTLLPGKVH